MVVQARKANTPRPQPRPSPVSRIGKIASLTRYNDREYALDLLHEMAIAVAPLISEFNLKVGLLCEMYPKAPNLLGLNVNGGQKILIRLRAPHNDRSFLAMPDLVGTLLHELTHNVHGPHDAKFYAYLDRLKERYHEGNFAKSDYVCEQNRLGSQYTPPWAIPKSVREKRLEALAKGVYKAEVRRVGGLAPKDMRTAIREAAEKRYQDSKWCSQGASAEDVLHEVQEVLDVAYREVIDLTQDEAQDDDEVEIVSIDACEQPHCFAPAEPCDSGSEPPVKGPQQYFVPSSSGRTFISDGLTQPRRKMVADVPFEQIIEQTQSYLARERTLPQKFDLGAGADPAGSPHSDPRPKKSRLRTASPTACTEERALESGQPRRKKSPPRNPRKATAKEKAAADKNKPPRRAGPRKQVRCMSFEELFSG